MKKSNLATNGNRTLELSVVAIIFSTIALCICSFRCEPIDVNIFNLSIGFLSTAVTIYVGLQIYQAITLRKKINDDIENFFHKIKKDVSEQIEKKAYLVEHSNLSKVCGMMATNLTQKGEYGTAILYIIYGIDEAILVLNRDVEYQLCEILNDMCRKGVKLIVTNDFKHEAIGIVSKISYKEKRKLMDYILSLNVED